MYPRLNINTNKLIHNAKTIIKLCNDKNISVFLVTKVLAGNIEVVKKLANLGFTAIADSRIENLKKFKNIKLDKVLLRVAMDCEITELVEYANISLQSELATIKLINQEAEKKNIKHKIILMFDVGDLREGLYYQDNYLALVQEIRQLNNIELLGIGTNMTCFAGLVPNKTHLNILTTIKENIKKELNFDLLLISAGNSSFLPLLKTNIPASINNLRLGEAIYFGHDTSYFKKIPNTYHDAFILEAKLVEVQVKPSYPKGKINLNAFGEKPNIKDKGLMLRGICALGRQDIMENNLFPLDKNINILGASSDHLILELNSDYKLGDIIRFKVNYPGLLQVMNSDYIYKVYL